MCPSTQRVQPFQEGVASRQVQREGIIADRSPSHHKYGHVGVDDGLALT